MKHLFIVNPAAGGCDRTPEISAAMRKIFAGRRAEIELYTTAGPMDAAEKVAREAENCEALRVYACGGDGTLNECVCGAALRENVAVTNYPTGTGNDFIKTFGDAAARFRSLENLVGGTVRKLDLIDCNGRRCINICSVGVDARIGTDVHKYTGLPLMGGSGSYIASTAVNLVKGVRSPLRVICGGRIYYGDMSLVCACNGSYYGGGFHPVPEARPDDGALDFLIVKGVSRLNFLRIVGAYARGRYADFPKYITHVRGDSMEIRSEREMVVNVDGEAMRAKRLMLTLLPGALNFILPANDFDI